MKNLEIYQYKKGQKLHLDDICNPVSLWQRKEVIKMTEDTTGAIRPMTLGELRVRATFNPSDDPNVSLIKTKTAELIDLVETIKGKDPRLAALAQTHYEDAAMWAVKLATAK